MIVLDASFLFGVLTADATRPESARDLLELPRPWCAPHLVDAELAQALRRRVLTGRIRGARGAEALEDLAAMPIARYPHQPLLPRVWELRHVLTAYDAIYVALAEALEATLVTCDAKLASAARELVRVDLRTAGG